MKKSFSWFAFSVFVLLGWFVAFQAQGTRAEAEEPVEQQAQGGIATLYALDPLARAFCFHDGREGLMIRNNQVKNRCADLHFNPAAGGFQVNRIEINRVGSIIDIGTADDLRSRYGQDEKLGVGFASLRFHGEKIAVFVANEDRPQEKVEFLKEASALFSDAGAPNAAPVALGHIYVLRIADTTDSRFQRVVKLMVIAHTPGESVTVRWETL